jgi:prevent-host-death family protein
MKTYDVTEAKDHLEEILKEANEEPVILTTRGEPTHKVESYPRPKTLPRPEGVVYFHEIEDLEERKKAVDEWIEGLKKFASSVDPGILKREDYYR